MPPINSYTLAARTRSLAQAADKADVDEKTDRKYRRLGRLPREVAPERTWRTRTDPFAEVWPEVFEQLQAAPGLEAKTLFAWLQANHSGRRILSAIAPELVRAGRKAVSCVLAASVKNFCGVPV
jgi:hypothetical protein